MYIKFSCGIPSIYTILFVNCCCCSVAKSCPTLCDAMVCSIPGFPVLDYLLEFKLMFIESMMPSDHLILSPPSPSTFNHSQHQDLFQWVDFQHQMVKVLELQLQHQSVLPMNILSWFPLGMTGLTSLQSKGLSRVIFSTTIRKHKFFRAQPFFMVQLSHPYMTTGKIIALTVWTFVNKVISLLFNILSRFVIAFLPRIKKFLILWLQLPSAVILVSLVPK